tara:strand:- start:95 stop:376 length:282 start_codon:yes stop_codon:yes gene_type:complete
VGSSEPSNTDTALTSVVVDGRAATTVVVDATVESVAPLETAAVVVGAAGEATGTPPSEQLNAMTLIAVNKTIGDHRRFIFTLCSMNGSTNAIQ